MVLGPGRECKLYALASGHRVAAFGHRHGKARCIQNLDHPACHPDLFAFAAWDVHRPVRAAYIRACVRRRSRAWALHSGSVGRVHRRVAGALRLAGARNGAGRSVSPDQPRSRAARKQPHSRRRYGNRPVRNTLSADPRGCHRGQDLGGSTFFQCGLHSDDAGAGGVHGSGPIPVVEAGRYRRVARSHSVRGRAGGHPSLGRMVSSERWADHGLSCHPRRGVAALCDPTGMGGTHPSVRGFLCGERETRAQPATRLSRHDACPCRRRRFDDGDDRLDRMEERGDRLCRSGDRGRDRRV